MRELSIDFETRATADLKKTGVYPYAQHPDTDVWCMAYSFSDSDEVFLWTPTSGDGAIRWVNGFPVKIAEHIAAGGMVRAWNASFERAIWREIMVPRYGAPPIALEQWIDTMAEAAAMSLPLSLDSASRVCKVTQQKDNLGYRLMLKLTHPKNRRAVEDDGDAPIWHDDKEKLEALYEYCKQDVRTEKAMVKVVRRLTPTERLVWLHTEMVNDRGVGIDVPLIKAAQQIVDTAVELADDKIFAITKGEVSGVTSAAQIREWAGVESIAKGPMHDLLAGDTLSADERTVLELRSTVGKTSVAKLRAMLDFASAPDMRLRGMLMYHAAGTGRWGGRGPQPQNFPRGEVDNVEQYIPAILSNDYETLERAAPPVVIVSSLLRSMLVPKDGNVFIAADLSGIEARVTNWLAGQDDVIANYRAFDAGDKSKDQYIQNAMHLFNLPFDQIKKDPHRQTGKFQELGCGFGMGHKKAQSAADTPQYGNLKITLERAKEIVDDYRATHENVVSYWPEANDACIAAVEQPGRRIPFGIFGRVTALCAGAYLYLILPSGRPLAYATPKVNMLPTPWGELKKGVEFQGVNSLTKQWCVQRLYGGLIVENVVQAVSRDILAEAMLRLESMGFPVVLSVHDEIVGEVPKETRSLQIFLSLMTQQPKWAVGLPLAAEGWVGSRYRK